MSMRVLESHATHNAIRKGHSFPNHGTACEPQESDYKHVSRYAHWQIHHGSTHHTRGEKDSNTQLCINGRCDCVPISGPKRMMSRSGRLNSGHRKSYELHDAEVHELGNARWSHKQNHIGKGTIFGHKPNALDCTFD